MPIDVLAQEPPPVPADIVGDIKAYLSQYFINQGVFAAAIMGITGLIKDRIKIKTQILSLIIGVGLGGLGMGFGLGIFAEVSIIEALLIVLSTTLGSNGLFDFITKTIKGKKKPQ